MSTPSRPVEIGFPTVQGDGGCLVNLSARVVEGMERHHLPGRFAKEGSAILDNARSGADRQTARWLDARISVKFSSQQGWSGDSYGLALVLADIIACWRLPLRHSIYATGIIGEDGSVGAVGEKILAKKLTLLTEKHRGSRFFYPVADESPAVAVTLQSLRENGIQTHGVRHVNEVLDLLVPLETPGVSPDGAGQGGGNTYNILINNGLYRADGAGKDSIATPAHDLDPDPDPAPTAARIAEFRVTGLPGITRLYLASAHRPVTLGRAASVDGPLLPLHVIPGGLSRQHLCFTHRDHHWQLSDPRQGNVGTLLTRVGNVELLRDGSARPLDDGDGMSILQGRVTFTVWPERNWLCFDIGDTRYLLLAAPVDLGGGCLPLPEAHTRCVSLAHRDGGFTITALAPGMAINDRPLTAGQCAGLQMGDRWHLGGIGLGWEC